MDLTGLASSQVPNALAIGSTVLLAVVALAKRDRLRWLYVVLMLLAVTVVALKNLSYGGLVVGVEGSLEAHRSYADTLFWVVVAQVALGVILMGASAASSRHYMRWLAAFAALASTNASLCMVGWLLAYLSDKPHVEYVLWLSPLHWLLLASMGVALVMVAVSLVHGRRAHPTTP